MDYTILARLLAHVAKLVHEEHEDRFKQFKIPVVSAGDLAWVYVKFTGIGYERFQIREPSGRFASATWADLCTLEGALI